MFENLRQAWRTFPVPVQHLEDPADAETTRRNQERLREHFTRLRDELAKTEEAAMKKMNGLTPSQQHEMLIFWKAASEFLMDVLDCVWGLAQAVLEKVKEGIRWIKEQLSNIFEQAKDLILTLFSK
eukprot:TRINITY_DN10328_c0_g1_i1.p1 TRINITY_DN10328_c0_g1~~TRINITY_DN10328_c0_g1_i1.p1  ORF type:complete len:126 (+),score=22.46 TRINITY_DN10328_c0_g1_i1:170-547(+)